MPARRKHAKATIFTIGHSTRPIDEFIDLLRSHGVQSVIDIRTIPKSRHNPQFNRETLAASLRAARIALRALEKPGRPAPRQERLEKSRLAQRQLSRIRRLHADSGISGRARMRTDTRCNKTIRADVRRSSALALPSLAGRRCAHRPRHSRGRNHERLTSQGAQAHAVRSRPRQANHLSNRRARQALT